MDQWATMGEAVRDTVDPASDTRVLWARTSLTTLVISSDTVPKWKTVPGAASATVQPLPRHPEGELIRWELIAAPTMQRAAEPTTEEPRPRGKRVTLSEAEFEDWLNRKMAGAARITTVKWKRLGGRPARYSFTGQAVVEDSEALQDLCLNGIGAGKGTGAGLLLTQPAATQ